MYKKISGIIFKGEKPEIITGSIYIDENKEICEIEEKKVKEKQWIIPRFINAHTHIGDSIIKDPTIKTKSKYTFTPNLDMLIKPPNGLKHIILKNSKNEDIVKSINNSFKDIYKTGTKSIVDFREGGIQGINQINKIKEKNIKIKALVLSRPSFFNLESNINLNHELNKLLNISDGFGISGYNDITEEIILKSREISKSRNKIFAIHAGEKNSSDILKSIELIPNILIHMTHANQRNLNMVFNNETKIVVCPRSNIFTNSGTPPIKEMLKQNICVGIGTDNIMLNSPNMLDELKILSKLFKLNENVIYSMLVKNNSKIIKQKSCIEVGNQSNLIIFNSKSYNLSGVFSPLSGFIKRARVDDIIKII